ncbi:hypothetical protein [Dongia deserti]|uniref:hypothetical protein n=1 Tax=Dongia deserti TaxID=2268030 RepID=UPI000E64763F|nr:hypothetical protein [Dongia deserti]
MRKVFRFIGKELKEALAPTTFFLLLFHLAAFTKALMLESYGITVATASVATIGALIVAKAILIADKLPWVGRLESKPLLISVLWKAALYALLCLVFRLVEELMPLATKHGGMTAALQHFLEEVSWPHFWVLQIWLLIALVLYAAVVELDTHLGAGIRKVFLGWPQRNAGHP